MTIAQRRWRLMWGNPFNHYRINKNAIEYRGEILYLNGMFIIT